MIITVDDEVPSDNDKQLGNNLIVILNVSLSSCIISLMISVLNDDEFNPAEMVTLNTNAVDIASIFYSSYTMYTTLCHYINSVTTLHYH